METERMSIVKRPLFSWVFAGGTRLKIALLVLITMTVAVRVIPLEMQKRIVNEAISLKKLNLLLLYCSIYLAAVLLSNGFKFLVNTIQTTIGQQAAADMRKSLYRHILTLPIAFFKKTQPGMVVSSLVSELSTAGDFIGEAVAVPIINLLTLLAFTGYLIWLHPLLGILSFAIYPLGLIVVGFLQKKANQANNQRVHTSRNLSDKIAESISGILEIQAHGAHHIENDKFGRIVDRLKRIRIVWNLYRFGIKVCNNFLTSLSQSLIFILGGYFVITGKLDLGSLVAFIGVQEKLYDPWKELIEFYQSYQEASVSYNRTMEYFATMRPQYRESEDRDPYLLTGALEVQKLSMTINGGISLLDNISFSLKTGDSLALVGSSGSGKSTLAQCIGQLQPYTGGQISCDGRAVSSLTKRDVSHNFGFVSQFPFIFNGTFQENIVYACAAKNFSQQTEFIPNIDDIIEILQQTGLFTDVLRMGLNTVLDDPAYKDLIPTIIRIRAKFQSVYRESLSDAVEFFDEEKYLDYASVAKNITFGTADQEGFREYELSNNPLFLAFLKTSGLQQPIMELGMAAAQRTVDIIGNLSLDSIFFEQSPMNPEELETYKQLCDNLKSSGTDARPDETAEKLLRLGLRFTPGIHKLARLSDSLKKQILEARNRFREYISEKAPNAFSFYRKSEYICTQSLLNNIFFGKLKKANPTIQDRIDRNIVQLAIEEDILETIIQIGLAFQVGSQGDRLSGGQRQKLSLARVLLKKPNILILDEATSALDNKSQARIQNLLESKWKGKSTLISVIHRLDIVKHYDKIAVMKAGKIEETGSYDELIARKGLFYELAGASGT